MKPLFPLGRCVITRGAADLLADVGDPADLLARHARLDPGVLPAEDVAANSRALKHGGRIFSAYRIGGADIWIITEADRASTTILLPEEY